jgi:hypothetical protein
MLAFLKLVPLKDWIYAGALALLLILFATYTHHERALGAARIIAADAAALDKAQHIADLQTAALKQKAEDASHAHDQELADLRSYRASHPVHARVCGAASHSVPGVPATGGSDPGHAGTSPPSGGVQPVSAGDNGSDDLGPMLELLAGRADKLSAQLREYQKR